MGCCGSVDGWESDVATIPENREIFGGSDADYALDKKILKINTGYSPADGWTFALHDPNSTYIVRATSSKENKKNKMCTWNLSNDELYSTTYAKGRWQIKKGNELIAEVKKNGGLTEYHFRATDPKGKLLMSWTCGMCCKDKVAVYRTPEGKVFAKLNYTQLTVGRGVNTSFMMALMCISILPDPMS